MRNIIDIYLPDIGNFTDVPIIEIPVSVGDEVAKDETILVLESDKATLDVPSAHTGAVTEILVREGDKISEGALVLRLDIEEGGSSFADGSTQQINAEKVGESEPELTALKAAPLEQQITKVDNSVPHTSSQAGDHAVYASPSVRKYARELGVDASEIVGTGPKGRVMREDVSAFVKASMNSSVATKDSLATISSTSISISGLPDWPVVDFASFGPVERQSLTRIAKISGPALARNSLLIPHVCNFDKADITELDEFRKILNSEAQPDDTKLSMLAFAVKAVVSALKAFPKFNSSLDGDDLIIKNYWNIGIAVDTPGGLVVPVIKQADQKGLREIASEMAELAGNARVGKLKASDMQGATFTMSSLGGIGGTGFTPIINAPEVAILGMTRAEIQPFWDGSEFKPRLMLPLSISWDHRVVDGVAAARFLAHISKTLNDFRRLSL